MDDEPKSAAELKEIRLNRKRTQEVEGIKAMARSRPLISRSEADREAARALSGEGSADRKTRRSRRPSKAKTKAANKG